jgi:hypothetical protein
MSGSGESEVFRRSGATERVSVEGTSRPMPRAEPLGNRFDPRTVEDARIVHEGESRELRTRRLRINEKQAERGHPTLGVMDGDGLANLLAKAPTDAANGEGRLSEALKARVAQIRQQTGVAEAALWKLAVRDGEGGTNDE